jgi:hypothetical protein
MDPARLDNTPAIEMDEKNREDPPEVELDYELLSDAFREGRTIKALHVTDEFLKTSHNHQALNKIFTDIGGYDSLEIIHLRLERSFVQGRTLGSALIWLRLEVLRVHSGLVLKNAQDINTLATSLKENKSLHEISLRNMTVQEGMFRGLRQTPPPQLEPLIEAMASMKSLQVLEITLVQSNPPAKQRKPQISGQSLVPLCKSSTLQRLDLSNLGLEDEHFITITKGIGNNSQSRLKELILNENQNTDHGVDMMTMLLLDSPDSSIQTFEVFQEDRQISAASLDLIERALQKNTVLTSLRIHAETTHVVDSFVQLNLTGRNVADVEDETKNAGVLPHTASAENLDGDGEKEMQIHQVGPQFQLLGLQPLGMSRKSDNVQDKESIDDSDRDADNGDDESKLGSQDLRDVERVRDELEDQGLPGLIKFSENDHLHNSRVSCFSIGGGDDEYLQDLLCQKERREEEQCEETLEDAMELYELALQEKNQPENEQLFAVIFQKLSKDNTEKVKEKNRIQDELIERELKLSELRKEQLERENVEEARTKAKEQAPGDAEEAAGQKLGWAARLKAGGAARLKAAAEALPGAAKEARLKAEEEDRLKAEEEARSKEVEEARVRAEEETRREDELREETLHDAMELYKIALKEKNLPENEQLFVVIFQELLKENTEKAKEQDRIRDSRI